MKKEVLGSKQQNALLKIGLWVIFVVIILVVCSTQNKDRTSSDEIKSYKNYDEMVNSLLNDGFIYEYKVINNGDATYYRGYNCQDKEEGYKENSEGIKRYIKDNLGYNVVMDEKKEEIELEVDLEKLFNEVGNNMYSVTKYEGHREIEYKDLGYSFIVETDYEKIVKIKINSDKEYDLEFTNVGICGNIESNN